MVLTATATGLGSGTHNFTFAIADITDTILDSGVFIQGGTFTSTEPPEEPPVNGVPAPASLMLFGLGAGLLALWRRKVA